MHSVRQTARISELHQAAAGNYPRIPVTRKWRLPWILVQLMKLSMLLESTVCLCSAPVPSHTAGLDTHCVSCNDGKETNKNILFLHDSTFWAESAAELTLPLASSVHLHLVRRTNTHAGTSIHHKMSCKRGRKMSILSQSSSWTYCIGEVI